MHTPEQRLLYPPVIGLIIRKNKPDIIIDHKDIDDIIIALNSNDFVNIENYHTTVHKFDVEDIKKVITKDEHRTLIDRMIKDKKEFDEKLNSKFLSLNDSIKGLQNYNSEKKSLTM